MPNDAEETGEDEHHDRDDDGGRDEGEERRASRGKTDGAAGGGGGVGGGHDQEEEVKSETSSSSKMEVMGGEDEGDGEDVDGVAAVAAADDVDDEDEDEATDAVTGKKPAATAAAASAAVPFRPVKKARTAYFIFAEERRPEIQGQHSGVANQAKALGQLWGRLTEEEKRPYQLRAAEERERVAREIRELRESGVVSNPDEHGLEGEHSIGGAHQQHQHGGLILPASRIRKIIRLDPEVKGVSREATLLITRSAELFVERLGAETVRVAQFQNRRKLLPDDVAEVCSTREQMLFLREDLRDLAREVLEEKRREKEKQKMRDDGSGRTGAMAGGGGSRPLTSYFGAATAPPPTSAGTDPSF